MTTSTSKNNQTSSPVTTTSGNLWQKGLIATLVAAVINLLIFAIGSLTGGLEIATDPANPGLLTSVPWFMVIVMTVIPILLGTGIYWLLRRIVPSQATRIFVIGAALLAILSVIGPVIQGVGIATQILLSLMHLVAGGALIWFTTR